MKYSIKVHLHKRNQTEQY